MFVGCFFRVGLVVLATKVGRAVKVVGIDRRKQKSFLANF